MAILIYCEIEVASPAPEIPILKVNIKRGSSAMFNNPPVVRPIMASDAIPSYLRILFITQPDAIAGADNKTNKA